MSLTEIHVRGFQSLKQADLELGTFTVIVGPSSSGKSALIRAFRALASNVRGTGIITRGQKQMAITARTDSHVISLERGERESAYRMTGADGAGSVFTKLGGVVPEQVTAALRLDPGTDSVNFAGQFDKPYLLDESGATIARQLGELTNVNQIFEAVRQANRVRASTLTSLRTRTADLAQVRLELREFEGLSERLKAYARAESLDERRRRLSAQAGRLETATRALRVTESALEKYKPFEVPDAGPLSDLLARVTALRDLTFRWVAKSTEARTAATLHSARTQEAVGAEQALAGLLADAKVCPTCGQHLRYLE